MPPPQDTILVASRHRILTNDESRRCLRVSVAGSFLVSTTPLQRSRITQKMCPEVQIYTRDIHICIYKYIYIYMYIYIVHIHVQVQVHVHILSYIYIYTFKHAYYIDNDTLNFEMFEPKSALSCHLQWQMSAACTRFTAISDLAQKTWMNILVFAVQTIPRMDAT